MIPPLPYSSIRLIFSREPVHWKRIALPFRGTKNRMLCHPVKVPAGMFLENYCDPQNRTGILNHFCNPAGTG
jgi:hypothetical protein